MDRGRDQPAIRASRRPRILQAALVAIAIAVTGLAIPGSHLVSHPSPPGPQRPDDVDTVGVAEPLPGAEPTTAPSYAVLVGVRYRHSLRSPTGLGHSCVARDDNLYATDTGGAYRAFLRGCLNGG
jgi:hypothetical protein